MEKIMNQSQLNQVKERELEIIKNSKCRILICAGTGCLAGGSGKIYFGNGAVNVNCGVKDGGLLGCLRLEDMKEFYV